MNTASEKQAERINQLTTTLYTLHGGQNSHSIISYVDALKLTEKIADDMIHMLEQKVKKAELDVYLKPQMKSNDILVDVTPIQFIDNYKVINQYRIDVNAKRAEIHTSDGLIDIKGESSFRDHNFQTDIRGLANMLKKSIDYDTRINIYKASGHVIAFLENADRDKQYREKVELFNRMLKTIDYKLPGNYKKELTVDSIKKVLPLIKARDTEIYSGIEKICEQENKIKEFLLLITDAKFLSYGLAPKNEEVLYY